MNWVERVKTVFANPRSVLQAAALHAIVEEHMQRCLHQRECREKQLAWEAEQAARTIERSVDAENLLTAIKDFSYLAQHGPAVFDAAKYKAWRDSLSDWEKWFDANPECAMYLPNLILAARQMSRIHAAYPANDAATGEARRLLDDALSHYADAPDHPEVGDEVCE